MAKPTRTALPSGSALGTHPQHDPAADEAALAGVGTAAGPVAAGGEPLIPDTASAEAQAAGLDPAAVPVTPMAPVTQPAPAVHEHQPTMTEAEREALADTWRAASSGPMQAADAVGVVGLDHAELDRAREQTFADPPRLHEDQAGRPYRSEVVVGRKAPPMPVGPQPVRLGHAALVSVLDRLARHPDGVVRARAAEAIAARKSEAADAGILARAAIDTAKELDRSSGRVVRPSDYD